MKARYWQTFCGVEAGLIMLWELFAFSCPLSLHCIRAAAQLLGLVFPSLPVFAAGGWGVSVGLRLPQGGPSLWASKPPQPGSRSVGFCLRRGFFFFLVSMSESIF